MISSAQRISNVGEYYFSKKLQEIREMNAQGANVLNLGIGSPDLPPAVEVLNKIKAEIDCKDSHGYQSYRSIDNLRLGAADFYKTHFDVDLDYKKEILPLLGSKEGVMYISMAFLDENDVVLVPNPGYPAYESAARLLGAEVVKYDLLEDRNWEPDLDSLDEDVLKRCKLMWMNYPNMPTGARGTNEMYKDVVRKAKKFNFLVCNDNPYSFILNDEYRSLLSYDPEKTNVLELTSLSKTFNMAGWRVGIASTHETYINNILRVKSNVDSGMFKPVQEASALALKLPKSWIDENNKVYEVRRTAARKLLKTLDCQFDDNQCGMFIWAKIPVGRKSEEFIDEILHGANVFITPGTVFGSNGEGYVRVSLCSTKEQFEESIERVSLATHV